MKTVIIPSTSNPWVCNINNTKYSYAAGSTQDVPDEVAAIIYAEKVFPPHPPDAEEPFKADGTSGEKWEIVADYGPIEETVKTVILPIDACNKLLIKAFLPVVEKGSYPYYRIVPNPSTDGMEDTDSKSLHYGNLSEFADSCFFEAKYERIDDGTVFGAYCNKNYETVGNISQVGNTYIDSGFNEPFKRLMITTFGDDFAVGSYVKVWGVKV